MLHTQFQASEPSGSEEDFLKIFYVFLQLEPRSPGQMQGTLFFGGAGGVGYTLRKGQHSL